MDIYKIIRQQMLELQRGDESAIRQMLAYASKAKNGAKAEIKRLERSLQVQGYVPGKPPDPEEQRALYQIFRNSKIVEQLETYSLAIERLAKKTTLEGIQSAFEVSRENTGQVLNAVVRGSFNVLPNHALESLSAQFTRRSPLTHLLNSISMDAGKAARETFTNGIALGWHPSRIASGLEDSFNITATRAITIARTEHARAYNTGTMRNYEANSDILLGGKRVCARDSRTCFLCWALDGEAIEFGADIETHPNCRCVIVPVLRHDPLQAEELTGEEIFSRYADREPGKVEELLGPSRYRLYKTGQVSLRDMVRRTYSPVWGGGIGARNLMSLRDLVSSGRAGQKTVIAYKQLSRSK